MSGDGLGFAPGLGLRSCFTGNNALLLQLLLLMLLLLWLTCFFECAAGGVMSCSAEEPGVPPCGRKPAPVEFTTVTETQNKLRTQHKIHTHSFADFW